jgi:hypothetical protein
MPMRTALCAFCLFAAAAFAGAAVAQAPDDSGPGLTGAAAPDAEKSGTATLDSDAVARLSVAAQLVAAGRATGSPYALAAAAELFASAGVRDSSMKKERTEGGEAPEAGSPPTDEPVTDAEALFAEAAELANADSNRALAAQIEAAAAAAGSRSPVGTSSRHRDRVNPHATDVYMVRYRGGETARATAAADDRYDIDLYVYDESGGLVAFDNDLTGVGICSWKPGRTGDYYLKVKNTTGSHVSYLIYTN